MVRVDQSIIARLKKEGEVFEVLVDCDKALAFREGKVKSLSEVLASKGIYKDAKKGDKASEKDMKRLFKTDDEDDIAAIIIRKGEIQLTTEHKNTLREAKKKQIVAFLHQHAVDAKTGLPFPPQRIEMLMEEAKVKIDEFATVEAQVQNVLHLLRPIVPIKIETREIEVSIPAKYAGPSFSSLKRLAKIVKEGWQDDGSLLAVIEIPAGIQEEIENELNRITKGEVELRILNKK
ncbi:ribosome assembly factor SBDS [Candidatus Woesearchaeota archaeon]|nr:ribosome assembly factor SBDS [Candidatus Woesearchaeota archaeon]